MKNLSLLFLLLFIASVGMAQKPLTNSRISSYYTYIFPVKDADVEQMHGYQKYLLDDKILGQPIDSARTDNFKMPVLKPGNYLRVYATENKLEYKLIENHSVFLKILDNHKDLRFILLDTAGHDVTTAEVLVKNARINYLSDAHMYRYGHLADGTLLKVKYAGVTNYFEIGKNKGYSYHSTVSRWFYSGYRREPFWRKVVFETPIRYLSRPFQRWFSSNRYYGYKNYSADYAGYMAFNKPMYKPGDTVKFKAYIAHAGSKKPVSQKQLLLKIKNNRYADDAKTIGVVASYRDGAFEGQIVLSDSLKLTLDKDCIVSLELPVKKKKDEDEDNDRSRKFMKRILMAGEFKYEDYELKAIKFSVRADKENHSPGEPASLYFKAVDENELPVADGRVQLTFTTGYVNQYNNQHVFVPDTLWTHKLNLDAVGETKLQIPDSIFAKADIRYNVQSVFLNSNNESQTRNTSLNFSDKESNIVTSIDRDTLKINYRLHGKDTPIKAMLNAINNAGAEMPKIAIQLPAKILVNNAMTAYSIKTRDTDVLFSLNSVKADITSTAYRNADSVYISVSNPRHIQFWYTIFSGDHIMDSGTGTTLSYKKAYSHSGNVFLLLNYIWGGVAQSDEVTIQYLDKLLDISVKQPIAVYPGQQVEMEVNVKNAKGQPVANADLTAYSFTSKFNRQINFGVPYFGKQYPARQQKLNYQVDDKNEDGFFNLNWQRWSRQMGLDSIEYYKFTHPEDTYRLEEAAPDTSTQIAPFVMYKGVIQPIYIVYIDNKPVYFNQAEQLQRYSFKVKPGKHNINLRTLNQSIWIDAKVQQGKKLILSINGDTAVNMIAHFTKMPATLTPYEAGQLDKYMTTIVDNFGWKNATLSWMDNVYLLNHKTANLNYNYSYTPNVNNHILVGPLPNNYVDFTQRGESPRSFLVEPDYSFQFLPGLIKQKSISKRYPFDVLLNKTTVPAYNQYPLTFKETDTLWQKFLDERSYSTQLFPRENIQAYHNGKLLIKVDGYGDNNTPTAKHPLIKNIIVYRNDNLDYMRIYPGNTTNLQYLQPGVYRLLFLLHGDGYSLHENVVVKANGNNYYQFTLKPKPKDDVSLKIANVINNRSGLYDNDNADKDLLKLKEAFNDTYLDRSTFTGYMTGHVTGASDKQNLPGVSIKVKGTSIGTQTDVNGNFKISVPTSGRLIFAFIGYTTQEMTIASGTFVNVAMREQSNALNEVVVVGYGTQSRRDVTGSVATISGAMQGKVAGLMIRGASTPSAGSPPMYVIDGVVVESGLAGLDPSLIADMSVLKDAAATAVYGNRAANGVVVITTRKKSANSNADAGTPDQQQTLRTHFSDYAYWQPKLTTDANGKAKFTVTFPDDITKWKTGVIGVSGKQTGFAEGQIKAFKSLSANFVAPLFAVKGDEINPIGKVMNYTTESVNVNRTFKYNGQVVKQGLLSVKNSLIDTFKIVAADADSLHFEYTIKKDNGYFDGERRSIPVFEQGVLETKGSFADLERDTTITLNFDPSMGKVTFRAEASVLPVLTEETEHLRNYEYLCNEQLASKLKGLLVQKRIKKYLGEPFKWDRDIIRIIKKLQDSRRNGLMWGWWQNSDEEIWISLHAVEALIEAGQEGYAIQLDKQKLIDYLVYRVEAYTSTDKLDAISLLIKLGGKADYARLLADYQKKLPKRERLSAYEKMRLMLVKQQAGLPIVLDSLSKYQHSTMFGNLYWGQPGYSFFDNSIQLSAMAYRIYKADGHYTDLLPKIRNYFLEQREATGWRNTYESALILETILPDLLGGGKTLQAPTITLSGDKSETITKFPYSTTINQATKLTVAKKGDLPVYITGYQQFWNKHPEKVSKDFTVNTRFLKGRETITKLKGGEPISLEVAVTARADADFVMIEIPIPAGCSYDSKDQNYWSNEVHREYFKNKVSIFCRKLKQGSYNFSIKLMPRYSGTYTLNPAKAEMMYFPVFYGREEMRKVSIE